MPIVAPERIHPTAVGTEREQLTAWLDFYRATLLAKCADLTDEQLRSRPIATSNLSLLGILRHMGAVEWWWFEHVFAGLDTPQPIDNVVDQDADFNELDMTGDHAATFFLHHVALSRTHTGSDLDQTAAQSPDRPRSLRWIMLHMLEEYARHCGHADILREAIDGITGY